jgi:hypothetical protein
MTTTEPPNGTPEEPDDTEAGAPEVEETPEPGERVEGLRDELSDVDEVDSHDRPERDDGEPDDTES